MPIVDETLKELFGILLGWMEYSHYKCDLENDRDCYAEQYGDGSAEQHRIIRLSKDALSSQENWK